MIGKDGGGGYTRERFLPGSLSVPDCDAAGEPSHDKPDRRPSHRPYPVGDEVHVSGVVVDTVVDGHEALELAARARWVPQPSSSELGAPHTRINREAGGGQLVEPSRVLLRGVGLVPQPAYRSARLLRLLDRRQTGRQREAVRRRHLAELGAADRRAQADAARVRGLEVLERTGV